VDCTGDADMHGSNYPILYSCRLLRENVRAPGKLYGYIYKYPALFTAKNAKHGRFVRKTFAPQCDFVSAFIRVYLRFHIAVVLFLLRHRRASNGFVSGALQCIEHSGGVSSFRVSTSSKKKLLK
jgi:hypothetical protein